MSPKTANKPSTNDEETGNSVSAGICAEVDMDMTASAIATDAPDTADMVTVVDGFAVDQPEAEVPTESDVDREAACSGEPVGARREVNDDLDSAVDDIGSDVTGSETPVALPDAGLDIPPSAIDGQIAATEAQTGDLEGISASQTPERDETAILSADSAESSDTAPETPTTTLPDPTSISARLKNLVVEVGRVEELSRHARDVAASDLALYDGIAASQRQFEDGLVEARRIGQEAQAVYERAFGREARAVAEPAVAEAREVEQAFDELANAWRHQSETFLAEHPDVETLLVEQRQRDEDTRRRELARAKAQRFQELVTTTDAALRQGLLDEARDCLGMLGREFPAESSRFAPLQDRLHQKVRSANDAAARGVLFQASELQGRGEFDAAVRLLEAIDVTGLSRETSEDVFGRWSAACSLLGQTGDLELLRSSSTQGRGVILHTDPSVPYGLVVFSALGMGRAYFQGRVVSAADPEGAAIIARARPFRAAQLPADFTAGWYGRSYVTTTTAGAPVRH